ncbi:hypothetical protein F5Y13DRAFT_202335 [Hypoxylon sp. FL1857]|nr:hypothetical protein F5Y13DRAFT_202335 [Hypoxylon sp. FL1857]
MDNHEAAAASNLFRLKLANEWKCKACCGREYYRSNEIVKWMLRRDTDEMTTNAGLLLTEAYQSLGSIHHPASWKISNEEDRCLIVLAILLELGYGQVTDVFQRYGIIDKKLPMTDIPNTELLEKDLERVGIQDTEAFWERFKERMWLYYPCPLDFGMRKTFLDPDRGRWIMPFFKRQRVNMKGGTAQVWEVAVQESLIPRKLAMAAGRSVYTDLEHGLCYVFALKTFTQESREIFEWEREAYLAVQAKGHRSGMVQFLGEYEIDETLEGGMVFHTWNILLEYGDEDLEEFFASPLNYPPNLNPETVQFWNSLANVAKALDAMHNLDLERENGRHDSYSGWHCDLKPDNILRVDGEFKLADFGFAKFKPKNPGRIPKQYITGGTETYGAPECDRARLDPSICVSQTIDTWSFGCVLSVSATWVVLGYQGVRAYHELRRIAIKKLRERQEKGANITAPAADDAFHNGVSVLPEVREWHDYLRKVLRVSDTITGRILDLVDDKMLLAESARPSKSEPLYDAIQRRLKDAQEDYDRLMEGGIILPVAESVKEALLSVENEESSPTNSQEPDMANSYIKESPSFSSQSFLAPLERRPGHQVKSSRIKKHQRIADVARGRVAHRQEALRAPNGTAAQAAQLSVTEEIRANEPDLTGRAPPMVYASQTRDIESSDSYGFNPRLASNGTSSTRSSPFAKTSRIPAEKEVLVTDPLGSHTLGLAQRNSVHPGYGDWPPGGVQREEPSLSVQIPAQGSIPMEASLMSPSGSQFSVDPSWPIYIEHQAQKSKEKGFKALLLPKKHDDYLKKFLSNRDIMFLVDNDATMSPLWERLTVVLETLVFKVGRLDKNGLDIAFTMGNEYNANGLSGKQLLAKFRQAKLEASVRPYHSHTQYPFHTNMVHTLTHIFDEYLLDTRRAKTLIILTDGHWGGTIDSSDVERSIAGLLKKPALMQKLEKRWFTIQFIACGNEVPDILTHLDDDIANKYSIPDVIDTEHVSGDVYKMILGSFVDQFDVAVPSPISPTSPSTSSHPGLLSPATGSPLVPSPVARQNSSRSSKRFWK